MLKNNDHAVPEKQKHGYRFWILQFRRKVTSVDPRVFDYLGYFGLVVLSLWALFYGLGDYGIINGNESLYVESAREMAFSGNWAVPTLNGLPYLEKPPLFIWLITAATSLSSSIELPPRLVTASAALLLVLGMVRFSVLLHVGKRGFAAAFILITTLGIDIMSRVAMPDMILTAFFSLGCLSVKAALQTNSLSRLRLGAGLLGAASLIKGALPLMLFGLIVIAYYYLEPTRRSDIRRLARDPFAILLMFLPLCLWLIAIEIRLPGAANHVIVNEHIQRFLGLREPHDYYAGSPLYYVPRLFLFFFPWAGVLLFGWLGKFRNVSSDKQQIRRFLWLCVWIPFGFFTLSAAKANYYILLCLPAMALLTADYLPDLLRERRRFYLAMSVIMPVMLLMAIWAFRIWAIRTGRTEAVISLRDGSGSLTIAVLLMLSLIVLLLITMGWRRQAILCLGGLLVPVSLQFDHLVARAEAIMSARTMASFIQDNYRNAPVYLYQDFEAIGALPIYLKRTVPVIDSRSNDLYFGRHIYPDHPNLVSEEKLLASGEVALIVVMKDRQRDFANTSLAKNAIELTTIGRTKLFRFAR
jgi:4-amino-4-deoxy-L-arabinose transferase-like glycosyltransferase